MLAKFKLGTKLIMAFALVSVVTLFLGAIGYVSVDRSNATIGDLAESKLPSVNALLNIEVGANGVRAVLRSLMIPGMPADLRAAQYEELSATRADYEENWKQYEGLARSAEAEKAWQHLGQAWQAWRDQNSEYLKLSKELDVLNIPDPVRLTMQLNRFIADHNALETKVLRALYEDKSFEGGTDPNGCNFGKWLKSYAYENPELTSAIRTATEAHTRLHTSVAAVKEQLAAGKKETAQVEYADTFVPMLGVIHTQFGAVDKLTEHGRSIFEAALTQGTGPCEAAMEEARRALHNLVALNQKDAKDSSVAAFRQGTMLKNLSIGAMLTGALGSMVLGLMLTRSITRPINRVVEDLSKGAALVAEASEQVNQSSTQLATASTEQATALQETTAALENMSSMAVENAASAKEANTLVTQARGEAEHSDKEMSRLTAAMSAINDSSQQISRIIKVIEEIAFQTNLLALNAAVEAARAGEHGKGFAVVADEVRNLAQRAAEAARETTALIETSVARAKEGTDVSGAFGTILSGIVQNVSRASSLVGQIDAASQAQSEGVEQIRVAITQMDQVTQSIAASSEESAAAVQELSAQACAVAETADRLGAMVGTRGAPDKLNAAAS